MTECVIAAVVAYLMGSIPFGFILARVFLGTDVRKIGSGNIGATNVMRTGSKRLGIATLLLDAAKGYAAVYVATVIYSGPGDDPTRYRVAGIAAICAILGHVFPVWLKFKGGKGVATGVGVFLALAPKTVGVVLIVFILIVAISRYVSLASMLASALFPIVAMLLERNGPILLPFMIGAAIVIIAKHHANIRRLLSGTENRLELRKR
jgi:glycerol-3-phosphate acyltransferase PlsY